MIVTQRSILFLLLPAVFLGMLYAGLYPFNYSPKNEVLHLEGRTGIRFYGNGQAVSTATAPWPARGYSGQPITWQLYLKPFKAYYRTVPHILSLCDDSGREVFTLGQWKNHLVLRFPAHVRRSAVSQRETGTADLLYPGRSVILTFVFHGEMVEIYADGRLAGTYWGPDLPALLSARAVHTLILGNSSLADQPWLGEVLGFSVFVGAFGPGEVMASYEDEFSGAASPRREAIIRYRFDQPASGTFRNEAGEGWELDLPSDLTPLRREFLSIPTAADLREGWFYMDTAVNLPGFAPLGFLLTLMLLKYHNRKFKHAAGLAIASGLLLSLFIELNQGFLVTRDSSLMDLFLNTLGTAVGAGLIPVILKRNGKDLFNGQ